MPFLTKKRPELTELVEKVMENYDIYSAEKVIERLEKELYEKSDGGKNWARCTECKKYIDALISLFDLIKSHEDSISYAEALINPFGSDKISKVLYPDLEKYLNFKELKTEFVFTYNNNYLSAPFFPCPFVIALDREDPKNKEAADKAIDYMKSALENLGKQISLAG